MRRKTVEKTYHIGFAIEGHTFIIEARRDKDFLSCELYDYMGEHIITKERLHEHRYEILTDAKRRRPEVYGQLRYAIVD